MNARRSFIIDLSRAIWAEDALLPSGWVRNVLLQWDAAGCITAVHCGQSAPAGVVRAAGPMIPGMPNLHSHAFQRVFAGLTELRDPTQDNFWSWRRIMYGFANRITPEALEDIACWLYIEMLEAGYTSVCEFHYLHHGEGGQPYADDATLSLALLRAASKVGIGMTLLPVLYQTSGFGAAPAEEQARFIRSTDNLLDLLQRLSSDAEGAALGLAPHSLRAVPPESLQQSVAGLHALLPQAPVHIHIAEQTQEVQDCLAWSGQTPVQWLLAHAPVDECWCLVHATHMTRAECAAVLSLACVRLPRPIWATVFLTCRSGSHMVDVGGWALTVTTEGKVYGQPSLVVALLVRTLYLVTRLDWQPAICFWRESGNRQQALCIWR